MQVKKREQPVLIANCFEFVFVDSHFPFFTVSFFAAARVST